MRKLFLTSLFAKVSKLLPEFLGEEYKGKSVTFIPTASFTEKVRSYVDKAREGFENLGIIVDELDVSKASKEEIVSKLTNNDYIYVAGGNTFYLMQELKNSEADKIIIDQINKGKVYIGESAGSMIVAPDIKYVEIMDDRAEAKSLDNDDAFGIIDFYPVPHYTNYPFEEAVEKIIEAYDSKLDLRLITNKQVITVKGNMVKIVE